MRFTDMRMTCSIRHPSRLCVFLLLAAQAYCGHDIDLRSGATGGGNGSTDKSISNWAPDVELQYRGEVPLPQSFAVLLGEEFRSESRVNPTLPRLEINYPVNSVTSAGLAYYGLGAIQVRGFSQVISQSKTIGFPIAKQEITSPLINAFMTQRYKNGAVLFMDLPVWRFKLAADALYNDLIFDYSRDTTIQIDSTKTHQRLTQPNNHDADLWGRASLAFDLFDKKLWVKAAALLKNDLNPYKGYNFTGYYGGIEGSGNVFANALAVSGDMFARYYQSEIMDLKGYNDKLGAAGHLRLVAKVPTGFFIKGDCAFESASTMRKVRGELAVRKAWLNKSVLEAGFWTTAGGLFPRQCAYLTSSIAVSPRDMVIPDVKVYAHLTRYFSGADSAAYVFQSEVYRTDVGMMFRHDFSLPTISVLKNLSFDCGAAYRWITNMPYLDISPQNLDLFVGISNWM
jgi:hypothetical protein